MSAQGREPSAGQGGSGAAGAHPAGDGGCLADSLRAEIAAQAGAAAEACPLPSEATDFLHWPWVWRAAQFFLVLAVAWLFWPAAAKISRVCLYLAAAATVVGGYVQGHKGGGATNAGVAGGYWRRWRAAVRMHPEQFAGPLWLLTAAGVGGGFCLAAQSGDAGRSVNGFVEKADALLIGLLAYIHFQFTAARRQPFWLYGVVLESWLIGLTAISGGMALAYGLQTGWPLTAGSHGGPLAPLSGWNIGYGTEFGHWAALAGVLVVARMAGDRVFSTAAADPVTAARIKATRVLLCGGNAVLAVWSVQRWLHANVGVETIGWPEVDTILRRQTSVYAERFGSWSPWVVMAAAAGLVLVVAVCVWRALGQRTSQMRGAAQAQAAAGVAALERGGWRSVGWMGLPMVGAAAGLWAAQKHGAEAVVVAAGVVLGLEAVRRGKPVWRWALLTGLAAGVGLAAWGIGSASLTRSVGMRKVWWGAAAEMIAQQPGGHGFGQHIYRAEYEKWWNTYGTGAEGRGRESVIPAELWPKMEPGWGTQDLAFHEKWLTWEVSKGFDPHSALLQAAFEGGWIWLGILGAALGVGVWIRGGWAGGPSALVDLLPAAILALCLVDIPAEGLEKMFACMIAGWVAWGCRPRTTAAAAAPGALESQGETS